MFHRKLFPNLTSSEANQTLCSDYDDCYSYFEPATVPLPPPSPASLESSPPVSSSSGISLYVIIAMVVLVSLFLLGFYYTIVVRYWGNQSLFRRRRAPVQSNVLERGDDGENSEYRDFDHGLVDAGIEHPIWFIRTVGLQQAIINSITAVQFKKGEGLIEGADCSVCLSEFQEGETLRLLPKCNHAFHISCIDTWLRSHTNCPLCRAGIVLNPGRPSLASADPSFGNSRRTEGIHIDIVSEISHEADSGGHFGNNTRNNGGGVGHNVIRAAAVAGDDEDDNIEMIHVLNQAQIKADADQYSVSNQCAADHLGRRSISMDRFPAAARVHSDSFSKLRDHNRELHIMYCSSVAKCANASTTLGRVSGSSSSSSSSAQQASHVVPMKRSSSWCGRVSSARHNNGSSSKLSP